MLLVYSNVMSGKKFFSVMNLFIVQHLLKVIRLYALIKERKNSYKQTKWARLTFNLFYLHAANVSFLASQVSNILYFSLLFLGNL